MTRLLFSHPRLLRTAVHAIRLANREEVPVGKIVALARNYAKHAEEVKGHVPESPVFFLKPASSILHDGGTVFLPERAQRVDFEVELAVVIGRTVRDMPPEKWKDAVLGFGVLLDMTARDLQEEAKKKGEPWALAKSFDTFCPISTIVERGRVADVHDLELHLFVNGEIRQKGNTKDMVHPVPKVLSYLSSVMTLEKGDVIATGTPEGVGAVKRGDRLEARIPGLVSMTVHVDERKKRG